MVVKKAYPEKEMAYSPKIMSKREQLNELAQKLKELPGLAAAYLYGSAARQQDKANSDIDIGLLYAIEPAPTLLDMPFAFETKLSAITGRQISLLVMNRAPCDLNKRILRDGMLLFENDRKQRIAFEVKTRNQYWDLEPALKAYRSML